MGSDAGYVIWLTGISGAGKSTLGKALYQQFVNAKLPVEFLDGDEVRAFFGADLGYSRRERELNVRRIAFGAHCLSKHGVNVIVANIAPYYEVREFIRAKLPNYVQIYVKSSLETVKARDVKGHYKNIDKDLIGVDDRYDEPRNPHVIVDSSTESEPESLNKILAYLASIGILAKANLK